MTRRAKNMKIGLLGVAAAALVAAVIVFVTWRCFTIRENFVVRSVMTSFVPAQGSALKAVTGGIARSEPGLYTSTGEYQGTTSTMTDRGVEYRGEWIQVRGKSTWISWTNADADNFTQVTILGSETGEEGSFGVGRTHGFTEKANHEQVVSVDRPWPYLRLVVEKINSASEEVKNESTAFFKNVQRDRPVRRERSTGQPAAVKGARSDDSKLRSLCSQYCPK